VSPHDATVVIETRAAVTRIRLHRPERRNALDAEMLSRLLDAVARSLSRPGTRVIVIEGAGSVFCAGADIEWMREEGAASGPQNRHSAARLGSLYDALDRASVPVVARVQGAALGGGLGLVAVSDVAVAADSTFFAFSEVRLGLLPAVVSPFVLAKLGPSRARDVFLTGRRFSAEEALAWGLVHRVVKESDLDDAVDGVVRELLLGSPEAIAAAKRLIRAVSGRDPREVAGFTASQIAAARAGEDGQRGLAAFLAKQPAPWVTAVAPSEKPARQGPEPLASPDGGEGSP
jgi:methylglutaconyl-CoA hydratase